MPLTDLNQAQYGSPVYFPAMLGAYNKLNSYNKQTGYTFKDFALNLFKTCCENINFSQAQKIKYFNDNVILNTYWYNDHNFGGPAYEPDRNKVNFDPGRDISVSYRYKMTLDPNFIEDLDKWDRGLTIAPRSYVFYLAAKKEMHYLGEGEIKIVNVWKPRNTIEYIMDLGARNKYLRSIGVDRHKLISKKSISDLRKETFKYSNPYDKLIRSLEMIEDSVADKSIINKIKRRVNREKINKWLAIGVKQSWVAQAIAKDCDHLFYSIDPAFEFSVYKYISDKLGTFVNVKNGEKIGFFSYGERYKDIFIPGNSVSKIELDKNTGEMRLHFLGFNNKEEQEDAINFNEKISKGLEDKNEITPGAMPTIGTAMYRNVYVPTSQPSLWRTVTQMVTTDNLNTSLSTNTNTNANTINWDWNINAPRISFGQANTNNS